MTLTSYKKCEKCGEMMYEGQHCDCKKTPAPLPTETIERLKDGDLKICYKDKTIYIQNVVVQKNENLMSWRVAALKRIEAGCQYIDNILGEVGIEPNKEGEVTIPMELVWDEPFITADQLKELRDILMGNNKGE